MSQKITKTISILLHNIILISYIIDMSKLLSWCMHCKKKTGNKSIKFETKNNRRMMKSLCTVCNGKKSTFLPGKGTGSKTSKKQKGKGIVDKFITALPVELHLLGTDETTGKTKKSGFIGPGTKLNKRLGPGDVPHDWSKPINDLDRGALKHDICYRNHKDPVNRNACDSTLARVAEQFSKKPGISTLDKVDAKIVTAAMKLIKRKV
jgi:hypothetical protein